eukprot:601662-Ditylum_brightwellii.AAC.1
MSEFGYNTALKNRSATVSSKAGKSNTALCTTRAIVTAGSLEDKEVGIEQFIFWNAMTDEEKLHYPYTEHWYFVPFNANGTSIAVIGFADIEMEVLDPDYIESDDPSMQDLESPTVKLIRWLL